MTFLAGSECEENICAVFLGWSAERIMIGLSQLVEGLAPLPAQTTEQKHAGPTCELKGWRSVGGRTDEEDV